MLSTAGAKSPLIRAFMPQRTLSTAYLQATQVWLNEVKDKFEIIALILKYSKKYNVDFELAFSLADFESNLDPKAANPKSTAKGIYQWLDQSWAENCEGNPYDAEDNIKCSIRVISEGGIRHWTADLNTRKFLNDNGYIK